MELGKVGPDTPGGHVVGERERAERQKPRGVEYRCRGLLADRLVVVSKLL
jgi:hypothetical protein